MFMIAGAGDIPPLIPDSLCCSVNFPYFEQIIAQGFFHGKQKADI